MDRIVYYHHPHAENFSLRYSSASPANVRSRKQDSDGATKLIGYPFETPVYVLYESNTDIDDANDVSFDTEWLDDRIDGLSRAGQVAVFRLVELLEAAVDAREGEEFRLYKDFEPQNVQRALDRVSWGAPVADVAGGLMSNLILCHSLPNANHRTSIAMLQFCIESMYPDFDMPQTHLDDETWQGWVDPYIVESKRLLTVRRNNVRFKRLEELGVDLVERKDGIQIRLADFDLDMHPSDAHSTYAARHENHCTSFASAVLDRADRTDLLGRPGPTKERFAEYLESGLVERDFSELF